MVSKKIRSWLKSDNPITVFVWITVGIGLGIISILTYQYHKHRHLKEGWDIDHEYLSAYGDFVGGVVGTLVGLLTLYLVYSTYKSQKKELRDTKSEQKKQDFENKLFKLIDNQRELTKNLYFESQFPPYEKYLGFSTIYTALMIIANGFSDFYNENESSEYNLINLNKILIEWKFGNLIFYKGYLESFVYIIKYIESSDNKEKEKDFYKGLLNSTITDVEKIFLFYLYLLKKENQLTDFETDSMIFFNQNPFIINFERELNSNLFFKKVQSFYRYIPPIDNP